jgi:flagellar biosynthesis protein FlhA
VSRNRAGQVGFPAAVLLVITMMVVPLPTAALDLLLATNLALAVLILLASMNVERPLDFSAFPSLLLVATLFRLGLNISSTRLILAHGDAGSVIHAFGSFVIAGSVTIGLVIFLILVVIQFVVITNGATRVAEVAARFTLDAMPGKQMAIDADLNAGLIDDAEAKQRREDISAEADFYGAMDGSSKFVKGDAIATIVITGINLVGGLIVGVVQHGLSIGDAVSTYSLLTVGDGLVSQIPALLISVASGIIITRSAGTQDLGTDVMTQFARQHRVMRLGGIAVMTLAIIPGLPKLPFLAAGGGLYVLGRRVGNAPAPEPEADDAPFALGPSPDDPEEIVRSVRVEPLGLELAIDLVDLVEAGGGGDLLDRVRALRRKLAGEMGFVIPSVRTRDSLDLPTSTYAILVHGVEVARGTLPPGRVLVIADDLSTLPGTEDREPVFGLPAKWVPVELRRQAEAIGATIVDRSAVVTTHLAEIVRANAGSLLGRQDVKALLEIVRESAPAVIEDLQALQVANAEIQRVLQNLLDEGVGIRDLVRILEAIGERARQTRDPEALVNATRSALGPAISSALASDGRLSVITIEPLLEARLHDVVRPGDGGTFLALAPDDARELTEQLSREVDRVRDQAIEPAVLCGAPVRAALRRLVVSAVVNPPAVLAYSELGSHLRVDPVGTVTTPTPTPTPTPASSRSGE